MCKVSKGFLGIKVKNRGIFLCVFKFYNYLGYFGILFLQVQNLLPYVIILNSHFNRQFRTRIEVRVKVLSPDGGISTSRLQSRQNNYENKFTVSGKGLSRFFTFKVGFFTILLVLFLLLLTLLLYQKDTYLINIYICKLSYQEVFIELQVPIVVGQIGRSMEGREALVVPLIHLCSIIQQMMELHGGRL